MQTTAGSLVEVEALEKSYGDRRVLAGVGFSIAEGERLGLMGPSGSGKSTLLNCLGGLDRPDRGSIRFAGRNLATMEPAERTRLRRSAIGTIFQFFHLLPTLSAAENIELPLLLNRIAPAERAERVAALLEEVDLGHRAAAPPRELSGGEMQRVAIARALALRPRLLLADEPTGNLDSTNGVRVLDLLEALSERHRVALVLVTHQPETTRICHRCLHLTDGRIDREEPVLAGA